MRTDALGWLSDIPRATFQRRALGLIEEVGSLAALVAWQDIADVDLEGIWLEVLAVNVDQQHCGKGIETYELVVERLWATDRDGDCLAGLVHVDNARSKRLLALVGWTSASLWDDHELWVGHL